MSKVLEIIYEGLIYLITVSLLLASLYFIATATMEAYQGNYYNVLLSLLASITAFASTLLTGKQIQKTSPSPTDGTGSHRKPTP